VLAAFFLLKSLKGGGAFDLTLVREVPFPDSQCSVWYKGEDSETTGTKNFNLFFDCLEIFICHIITPYKQNALKCACVSTEA